MKNYFRFMVNYSFMKHRYDIILEAAKPFKKRGFVFKPDAYDTFNAMNKENPVGILDENRLGFKAADNDIEYLVTHDDIIDAGGINMFKITPKAEKFLTEGGYTEFFRNKKLQDDKLRWDAMLSEWLVITKWWPLVLSAISLIIAFIALFRD